MRNLATTSESILSNAFHPIMSINLSIYTIPIFYILVLAPHAYAVAYIKRANKGRYDSANAHGQKFQTSIQKTVPQETLARYERAERAHKNGEYYE